MADKKLITVENLESFKQKQDREVDAKLHELESSVSGAAENVIESISVNGVPQAVNNKNVDLQISAGSAENVPTAVSELTNDKGYINLGESIQYSDLQGFWRLGGWDENGRSVGETKYSLYFHTNFYVEVRWWDDENNLGDNYIAGVNAWYIDRDENGTYIHLGDGMPPLDGQEMTANFQWNHPVEDLEANGFVNFLTQDNKFYIRRRGIANQLGLYSPVLDAAGEEDPVFWSDFTISAINDQSVLSLDMDYFANETYGLNYNIAVKPYYNFQHENSDGSGERTINQSRFNRNIQYWNSGIDDGIKTFVNTDTYRWDEGHYGDNAYRHYTSTMLDLTAIGDLNDHNQYDIQPQFSKYEYADSNQTIKGTWFQWSTDDWTYNRFLTLDGGQTYEYDDTYSLKEVSEKALSALQPSDVSGLVPVSGVNDGTKWTSLTIGSDTYSIGGGSSTIAWNNITSKPTFATVATTGSYADLSGKPTIPTTTSQLTNDSGYLTSDNIGNIASYVMSSLGQGGIIGKAQHLHSFNGGFHNDSLRENWNFGRYRMYFHTNNYIEVRYSSDDGTYSNEYIGGASIVRMGTDEYGDYIELNPNSDYLEKVNNNTLPEGYCDFLAITQDENENNIYPKMYITRSAGGLLGVESLVLKQYYQEHDMAWDVLWNYEGPAINDFDLFQQNWSTNQSAESGQYINTLNLQRNTQLYQYGCPDAGEIKLHSQSAKRDEETGRYNVIHTGEVVAASWAAPETEQNLGWLQQAYMHSGRVNNSTGTYKDTYLYVKEDDIILEFIDAETDPNDPVDDIISVKDLISEIGGAEQSSDLSSDVNDIIESKYGTPDLTTDGTYVLKATVSNGAVTYSWVLEA